MLCCLLLHVDLASLINSAVLALTPSLSNILAQRPSTKLRFLSSFRPFVLWRLFLLQFSLSRIGVSSIDKHDSIYLCCNRTTTMGGSQPACVHLTKLIQPEQRRARYQGYIRARSHERHNDPLSYTSDVSTIIRPQTNTTFWASSSRPDPTISDFAIATTCGTVIVAESQSSWTFDRIQTFKSEDPDASPEVLAVDWLDTNVLLNGCRDGTVRLWDARTCGASGTSWRVKHQSCINHVRRVDANRIVAAGLERQMAAYDLRYIRPKDDLANGVTRPYVEFPGYSNKELNGIGVGFDVCGNLVAAGTDEGGVQIFDGASGREVTVGMGGDMGKDLGGPATCLRFVDTEERRDGRRLFVEGARGIEQWTW